MIILIFFIAYLIGSIPFGYLVVRLLKGVDIRKFGSGNIGATNVARILGIKWGVLVFVLDFLKGFLAVYLLIFLFPKLYPFAYVLIAILSICGHNWSLFLKFKGGKGVSTSLGAISGLCIKFPPLVVSILSAVICWLLLFFIFRVVSLASLVSTFIFFLFSLFPFLHLPLAIKVFSFAVFILIVLRHKSNIVRLCKRKEFKF